MGKNLNVPKHIASGPGERVETTVLKRRKKIERVHADKVRRGQEQKKAATKKRELREKIFRNARDYINNFKRREANLKEMARRNRQHVKKPLQLPTVYEGSMALVIRVKGNDIPEVCRRLLKTWRLGKMYEGIFLTVNEQSLQQLHMLKDYVKWGYPTKEQVDVLLRTRGYTVNESNVRIPLGGNLVIESKLGEHNILCIEDMEHAISNHTDQFQAVVDFLAPFRLEPPAKDESEMLRRTRERNTTAGSDTFASYLLNALPELPAPKRAGKKRTATEAAPVEEAKPATKKQKRSSPAPSPKDSPKAAPKKVLKKKVATKKRSA